MVPEPLVPVHDCGWDLDDGADLEEVLLIEDCVLGDVSGGEACGVVVEDFSVG